MQWVFDASITLAWCFDDEKTPSTEVLFDRLAVTPAAVPQIWPLEVANVLALATRKARITVSRRAKFLAMLAAQSITVDPLTHTIAFHDILTLADAYKLTVYDAAYLELAMRLGVPLATLDKDLSKAAIASGVAVL
jgi:predicted nucleic acid-binding protein